MGENRGTQIKRILSVIEELQLNYTGKQFNKSQIVEFLEKNHIKVDDRTIQRDFKLLCEMDFIQKKESADKKNQKYELNPTGLRLKQPLLADQILINCFLKFLDPFKDLFKDVSREVDAIKSKIQTGIENTPEDTKLKDRVHLRNVGTPIPSDFKKLETIIRALPGELDQRGVGKGKYLSFNRVVLTPNNKLERIRSFIRPHFVFMSNYSFVVVGRVSEILEFSSKNSLTQITLSSMESIEVLKQEWQEEVSIYDTYFQYSFGINKNPELLTPNEIKLKFSASISHLIKESVWHKKQTRNLCADGSVEITMKIHIETDLIRWVASFGQDVIIVEGDLLRDMVTKYLKNAVQHYERP